MKKSHYQILGVARDAPVEAIVAAHRERRRQFAAHGDIQRLLDEAQAVLLDPQRRAEYDRQLAAAAVLAVPLPAAGAPPSPGRGLRSFGMLLLGGLLIGGITWRFTERRPAPLPAVAAKPVAPTPAAAPAPGVASPPAEATEPTAAPSTPTEAAPVAAAETRPSLQRPAKKAGFDPLYVAWSVFLVSGAKGNGSGVMVERDKVITNCHVIAGSYLPKSIAVKHSVTQETFYPEKIAILGEIEDVCLLHVPGAPDYAAPWGDSAALLPGAATHTVSYPGREGLVWSHGKFLERANVRGLDVLLTDNYCRPGVSGGPLFDDTGRVIGITSAHRRQRTGSGIVLEKECASIIAETARQVMWRTLTPIVVAPIKYDSVWSVSR